jgi:hypothetical protein
LHAILPSVKCWRLGIATQKFQVGKLYTIIWCYPFCGHYKVYLARCYSPYQSFSCFPSEHDLWELYVSESLILDRMPNIHYISQFYPSSSTKLFYEEKLKKGKWRKNWKKGKESKVLLEKSATPNAIFFLVQRWEITYYLWPNYLS